MRSDVPRKPDPHVVEKHNGDASRICGIGCVR